MLIVYCINLYSTTNCLMFCKFSKNFTLYNILKMLLTYIENKNLMCVYC